MQAILCLKYGPPEVLQLQEVERPAPGEGQVLVKVHAASVNTADLTFTGPLAPLFGGLRKPKDPRLGKDLAGRVEAVGEGVIRFQAGDEVFGACAGSFAEYALARQEYLVLKPGNVSFEQAASVPVAAITALQAVRDKGQVKPGQRVLVNGASGGVGTFTVQMARAFGAEVTAVCSPHNLDQARLLGAEHVIDYTRQDFTRTGQRYDLILSVNGYHPLWSYRHALSPQGLYVMVGASKQHLYSAMLQATLLGPLLSRSGGQKLGFMGIARFNREDLLVLRDLLEAGKIQPAIDKCYPLNETPQALRYLLDGHARGKVVITIA
ncbi:MAG: NAD(P)-dependent alcohol dehydrogenase [Acidobacteriaceae bacterium]